MDTKNIPKFKKLMFVIIGIHVVFFAAVARIEIIACDTAGGIIDPNMATALLTEPPTNQILETTQSPPTETQAFDIITHLRNLEMAIWDIQSILFNPIIADEDYYRAMQGMHRIVTGFWDDFDIFGDLVPNPLMEEEWLLLADLAEVFTNLSAVAFEALHGLSPEYHIAALEMPTYAAGQIRLIISELQLLLIQNLNIRNADLLEQYSLLRDIESRLRQADSIPIFSPNGVLSQRIHNAVRNGFFAELESEIATILGNLTLNAEYIQQTVDRYFWLTNEFFHVDEFDLWRGNPESLPILREYAFWAFMWWLNVSETEIYQVLTESYRSYDEGHMLIIMEHERE